MFSVAVLGGFTVHVIVFATSNSSASVTSPALEASAADMQTL